MKNSARETEWANLMRAAIGGDARAYRELLVSITPHVRAIARRRCGQFGVPRSEAEDVLQEVLLTIHLKRGSWDSSRPLGPWLSAIVRNKLIDGLRRRGRHISIPIEDVAETLGVDDGASIGNRMDVERILQTLRQPQQTIVRSISVEGASVHDTAMRLNMTEVAVRVSLHRALKALSAHFQGDSNGHE